VFAIHSDIVKVGVKKSLEDADVQGMAQKRRLPVVEMAIVAAIAHSFSLRAKQPAAYVGARYYVTPSRLSSFYSK